MKKWNEIRLAEGVPDDIVISDVDVHLEDMDGKFWWLGLYQHGSMTKRITFHIWSKSKIHVEVKENGLKTKLV